jgi:hypothetical protein
MLDLLGKGKQLARSAASFRTLAARTGARTGRGLAAARIGTSRRMCGGSRTFLLPNESGFSRVPRLNAFVRFLLQLLLRLHLLARGRRLLSKCWGGDGNTKRSRPRL